jgi:MFS family permease
LLGWSFFSLLAYVTLLFSLPNWAITIGLTASQGSVVGAMANLGQAISRPIIGHFADKAGCLTIAMAGTMLAGFFCFVFWIFVENFAQAVTFGLISGAVTGTYFTLIAPVCARVVGLVELPAGLSVVWISIWLPSLFAEPIALEMQRRAGRIYLNVQVFSGCMYIAAAACLFFLRMWKIGEIIRIEKEAGELAGNEGQISPTSRISSAQKLSPESKSAPRLVFVKHVATLCAFKKV